MYASSLSRKAGGAPRRRLLRVPEGMPVASDSHSCVRLLRASWTRTSSATRWWYVVFRMCGTFPYVRKSRKTAEKCLYQFTRLAYLQSQHADPTRRQMGDLDMAGARERRIAAVLGEEIRVAMARRDVNTLQLSRSTGISNSTLATLLKGTSAMDVDQLARICKALDLDPGQFYSDAIAKADGVMPAIHNDQPHVTRGLAQLPSDPRALLRFLIDNPDMDDELTRRLEQSVRHIGDKSSRAQRLAQEIRQLRRAELERALNDLPPQTVQVANDE